MRNLEKGEISGCFFKNGFGGEKEMLPFWEMTGRLE
jgi:hypothetical protein